MYIIIYIYLSRSKLYNPNKNLWWFQSPDFYPDPHPVGWLATQWFCWSLSLLNGYNWEYTLYKCHTHTLLVGGFNHLETYESQLGRIIPYTVEKKCSKPPTRHTHYISLYYILAKGLSHISWAEVTSTPCNSELEESHINWAKVTSKYQNPNGTPAFKECCYISKNEENIAHTEVFTHWGIHICLNYVFKGYI